MNNNAKKIVRILTKRKLNISFAESCTGGLLSSTITSINGSSKVFTLGLVVYSNKSKTLISEILFIELGCEAIIAQSIINDTASLKDAPECIAFCTAMINEVC